MKDQRALLNKCIKEDVPAIVISAKDICAVPVLEKYLREAKAHGCDREFIDDFHLVLGGFKAYQKEEPEKIKKPDLGSSTSY